MILDQVDDLHVGLVDKIKVLDEYLCTTALVCFPVVQLSGGAQVGKAEHIVKLLHMTLVDATNGKTTGTHVVVGDEVSIHLIANM